jgi:DNA polymerase III alpha subunit
MLALFKSHFSIGKSILTLDDPITHKEGRADSIFSIAKENNLKEVVLVEDSLTGFLQAKKVAESMGIQLIFGLRVDMCENSKVNPKESQDSRHKIIIFAKNSNGCILLNKIYSQAFSESFNAVDKKILKNHWNDEDLKLAIPFYDSFIFQNTMKFGNCTPNFSFTKPTFLLENNSLPFDLLLRSRVMKYAAENKCETEQAKSIYYKNKKDVSALQTYKCITGRTFGNKTLSKPNLDHFGSNEFCFQSWKEN